MGDRFEITPHMTPAEFDGALQKTYLGQAHIAGTGPEGKTCRECRWFFIPDVERWVIVKKTGVGAYKTDKASTHDKEGMHRKMRCNRPILNKAKRRFTPFAQACRLFEQAEAPHPAIKAPKS